MMSVNWRLAVGSAAAFCTTVAFVPQLIKIRRHGGRDLSYAMLLLYLTGVLLWLAYGIIIDAAEIIAANAAATALVAACAALKWARERPVATSGPEVKPRP
jgi:MtN3 and saliva related transmembrane protein